jgi:hypothetical protein
MLSAPVRRKTAATRHRRPLLRLSLGLLRPIAALLPLPFLLPLLERPLLQRCPLPGSRPFLEGKKFISRINGLLLRLRRLSLGLLGPGLGLLGLRRLSLGLLSLLRQ